MPVGQSRHAATDVEPVDGLYVPAAQSVQLAWPSDGLYVPVGQLRQSAGVVEPVLGL